MSTTDSNSTDPDQLTSINNSDSSVIFYGPHDVGEVTPILAVVKPGYIPELESGKPKFPNAGMLLLFLS